MNCSKNEHSKSSENNNKDSLSIYLRLADRKDIDQVSRTLYLKKALNVISNEKNDSITRSHLLEITVSFSKDNDWKNYKQSSKLLLEKSIDSKDTFNIAQYYRYKGIYFKQTYTIDSAFIYYLKSEKLFRKINDKLNLGSVLSNKSIVQYNVGDFVGADRSLTQAYALLKNFNEYQKLYVVFTMMGIVANETKDYNKAIDYYKRSIKIIKEHKINDGFQEATCLNNIGYVYQNKEDFKEAINNYKLALKDKTIKNGDPELYSLLIDNLAYCKFKLKEDNELPDLFYEALKVRESIDAKTLIVLSKIHLSEYYYAKNDFNHSKKFAIEALNLAKNTGITRDFLAALKQSSNVDNENASQYSKDYIRINDSIQDVERSSKEKFVRLELETDEISQENVDLEGRNRTLLYFLMFGGIIILFVFIIRYQRNRAKELLYLQSQQRANEEIFNLMASQETAAEETRNKEKKKIAKDIHDGVLGRMFGARMNLDSLNNNTDPESVEKRLAYLNELKIIEQDLREISHDLNREKQVLINNFVAIVNDLLEEQRNAFPSKVTFKISEDINWNNINNNIKINMYRILQEGLQNINKYANAKKIEVSISSEANNIILSIIDNGDGFDANKKKKGIGLQNMISRANDCKGIIDINSIKGEGTTIILTMPITKQS